MKNAKILPALNLKEINRKCRLASQSELEGASWLKRMSFCLADVMREIRAGFAAQADYPPGKTIDR